MYPGNCPWKSLLRSGIQLVGLIGEIEAVRNRHAGSATPQNHSGKAPSKIACDAAATHQATADGVPVYVFRTENELNSYLREHGPEASVGEVLEAAKGLQEALGVFVGVLGRLCGRDVCLGEVLEREPFKV